MHSSHSTHSSRFSSTMRSAPSFACAKMLTGQTSVSFFATAASLAAAASTSTLMNIPFGISAPCLGETFFDEARDVLDAFGHRDAGGIHALDLVGGGVGLALDDGAGVAEAHARHLVHEATGHEGDDREARLVLVDPVGELGFHAAAGLGVDGDRLGLGIGLEERHEL